MADFIHLPEEFLSVNFEQCTISFDFIDEERLENKALVLHDFLTLEECNRLIELMESRNREPEFDGDVVMQAANPKAEYRNNLRILVKGKSVADILFQRLLPVLDAINQREILCTRENSDSFLTGGMGMKGLWKMHSLNDLFRLCKYDTLGHFGPHYDGDYVEDPCLKRSLKTFMVYLNDDYQGGETSFSDDHDIHLDTARGIYCSPEDEVYTQLKARRGDLLIFDHKILHEGKQVTEGVKYIMRSDVMYERFNTTAESVTDEDRTCAQAVQLFHEGMKLEEMQLIDEAIKKYSRAYKLCPELEKYA